MSVGSLLSPNPYSIYLGHVKVQNDNTAGTITTQDMSYLEGLRSNVQEQIDDLGAPPTLTPAGDVLVVSADNTIVTSTNYGAPITINQATTINDSLTLGNLTITNTLGSTGGINNSELFYLNGLRSNAQAQIDTIGTPPTLTPDGDIVVVSSIGSIISSTGYGGPVSLNQDLEIGSLTLHNSGGTGTTTTTDLQYLQGGLSNFQAQINDIGTPPTVTPPGDMVVVSSIGSIVSSSSYGSPVTISQDLGLGTLTIHQNGGTGTTNTTDLQNIQGSHSNFQAQIDSIGTPPTLTPQGDIVVVSDINSIISSSAYGNPVTVSQNLTLSGNLFQSNSAQNIFSPTSDSLSAFQVKDSGGIQQFGVDTVNKIVSVNGQNSRDKFDVFNSVGARILQVDTANNIMYLNGLPMTIPYACQVTCTTPILVATYPSFSQITPLNILYNVGGVVNGNSIVCPLSGLYQFCIQVKFILGSTTAADRDVWLDLYKNGGSAYGKWGSPGTTVDNNGGLYTGIFAWTGNIRLATSDALTFYTAVGQGFGTVTVSQIYISFVKIG
jgi:hypothetical protein